LQSLLSIFSASYLILLRIIGVHVIAISLKIFNLPELIFAARFWANPPDRMTPQLKRFTVLAVFFVLFSCGSAFAQAFGSGCRCDHTISTSSSEFLFDGIVKNVKPGDTICFAAGTRTRLRIHNVNGTALKPVVFANSCAGPVVLESPTSAPYIVEMHTSTYFRFSGQRLEKSQGIKYGIELKGGVMGIDARDFSNHLEIDHLYINGGGFAGIVAKTDPTCDPNTWRGAFTLDGVKVHDNWVANTGGEGIYVGSSHYNITLNKTCSSIVTPVLEHDVINVEIYNNRFENQGYDGIQLGSCRTNCSIHDNTVYNYGIKAEYGQQSGIQVNPGTNADVYNNRVDTGTGWGIFAGGSGGSKFYNNIVMNAGSGGFICQDYAPVNTGGFVFANNTLINNLSYGIYIYSQNTLQNFFHNNIIVSPVDPTGFLHVRKNSAAVKFTEANNIKTSVIGDLKFVDASSKDFHLLAGSPAIDGGKDVLSLGVTFDLDKRARPKGTGWDIGAFEYQPAGPTSKAGDDKLLTLPTNSITLNGAGESITGITGYQWSKVSGPSAGTLANPTTANLGLSNLVEGTYVFELRVTDASGFDQDNVVVTVNPSAANQNPVANAGGNKTITLPTSSVTLNGTGTDTDGNISTYLWTKVSGPATGTMGATNAPNLSLTNLVQGSYVYMLTVTDNKSATHSSQATVTVNAAGVNQVPIVSAGAERTIFLPTTQVTLTATASDPDGSIANYLWEKKSGASVNLATNTNTLIASALALGNYVFRVTVTDNGGATAFAEVIVRVLQGNQSPTVDAGSNSVLNLPTNSINLTATGNDVDGTIASYLWAKKSGPAATLGATNAATLSVSGMVQGTYVFGVTATDNQSGTGYDEVTVSVSVPAAGPNETPLSIAGGNQSFSLPTNSANLYGSGFDPDGAIVLYSWVKTSGGAATLTNANKPTLTVSDLEDGVYIFTLTVTDDDGASDDNSALITVSEAGTNVFPVASVGANKVLKLPQTSTSLIGSGSDEDGQVVAFSWMQVSGATATLLTPNQASTVVSGLAEGDYKFRLTVTDNSSASDINEISVRVVSATNNLPPTVDAGPDRSIFSPASTLTLAAEATDDAGIATYQWTKLAGPTATLDNPTELNLSLSNLVEGSYTFQLTATDNAAASVFDIMRVSVMPGSFAPPVVEAGENQVIELPTNQISLSGTVTAGSSAITTTVWEKTLGPTATLAGQNTLDLQVTNMLEGTYLFTVRATDAAGKSASDDVQVIVNPVPPNRPPLVDAGSNQFVALPTSEIAITGTANDLEGTVTSVDWTQTAGPNTATLEAKTTLSMTAKGLIAGIYVFRLKATDNAGLVGQDEVIVFVSIGGGSQAAPPVAYAGKDTTMIMPNNSLTIIGEGIDSDGQIESYSWEQISGPTATMNKIDNVLELIELDPGEYAFELTVTDSDTLSATDQVLVTVIEKADEIPKFFSPNSDGKGDFFTFRNAETYKECAIRIFARSGKEVFSTPSYSGNWDGTYNGSKLAEGDYYYVLSCNDGRTINGALRLIR
jgi:gliding motility-associated-like protein